MSDLGRKKKRTLKISLVLIGSMALAGCGESGTRRIYNNFRDCASENSGSDCEMIGSDSSDYMHGRTRYYGRFMPGTHTASQFASTGARSRSVGIASVSRGGFGGSSGSHSSGS